MGRKKQKYLPFAELRNYIRTLNIESRRAYHEWHDKNKPLYAPKEPTRVWKDEWINWNDFLGTSNVFGNEEKLNRKDYRPYWDAVRYVHTLKLKTSKEYYEWSRGTERPHDVPDRPDAIYNKDWKGWKAYLGSTIETRIEIAKENEEKLLFILANPVGRPSNAIRIIKTKKPFARLGEDWDPKLDPVAVYQVESDKINQFHEILEQGSTTQWDDPSILFVANMGSLLWELDFIVKRIHFR